MKKITVLRYGISAILFLVFALLTWAVACVDIMPIGPDGSRIGLASVNRLVFDWFGVNLFWYYLTDWLGLVPIVIALCFAMLGLRQLISRRCIRRVDPDLRALGSVYAIVAGMYALFERVVINYRPVVLHDSLEPSFPSSHTMVTVCVMVTTMMQSNSRLRSRIMRWVIDAISVLIIAVTVLGRLISGVHWFTDIVGGIVLAAALSMLYYSMSVQMTGHK